MGIHSRRASVFRKSMVDDSSHLIVDDRSRPSHRVLFDDRAFHPDAVGERTAVVGESPVVRVPGRPQPPHCSTSQVVGVRRIAFVDVRRNLSRRLTRLGSTACTVQRDTMWYNVSVCWYSLYPTSTTSRRRLINSFDSTTYGLRRKNVCDFQLRCKTIILSKRYILVLKY